MLRDNTEALQLSRQVMTAVDKLCHTVELHVQSEGHPLHAARLRELERTQRTHTEILEKMTEKLTVIGTQTEQADDNRKLRMDRGTKLLVAFVGLGGPLIAGVFLLLSKA